METAINIGFSCSLLNDGMKQLIFSSEPTAGIEEEHVIDSPERAVGMLEGYIANDFPELKDSKLALIDGTGANDLRGILIL